MATVMRTFELSEEAAQRLDALAAAHNTNANAYLSGLLEASQVLFSAELLREIDLAIKDDDAEDYADDEEVRAAFRAFHS